MALSGRNNRRSWLPWAKRDAKMNNDDATFWLAQFIGKNLRVHASDGRVFGGQMKCTDKVSRGRVISFQGRWRSHLDEMWHTDMKKDRNIVLALAHEYRAPSADIIRKAVEETGNPSASVTWNSRYVGLVVVPGEHITKIEFEESTLPGQRNPVTL
jgi:small nuclear ribonucleoprotein (snRNP)-like protein